MDIGVVFQPLTAINSAVVKKRVWMSLPPCNCICMIDSCAIAGSKAPEVCNFDPSKLPSREVVLVHSPSGVGVSACCPSCEMLAPGAREDPCACSVNREAAPVPCPPGAKPSSLFQSPAGSFFLVLCPADKLCDVPSPRHDAGTAAAETNRVELLRLLLGKQRLSFPHSVTPVTRSRHPGWVGGTWISKWRGLSRWSVKGWC